MKWLALIKLIAPIIISAKVPHGDTIAPLVVHGIEEAEALKVASGNGKLLHAENIVNIGIDAANTAGAKIDKTAVNGALSSGISTVIQVANLIHPK